MTHDGSHINTGKVGENLACEYLVDKGYRIIARNMRRKWGEIDIICTVPRGTVRKNGRKASESAQKSVPRGTLFSRLFRRQSETAGKSGKLVFIEVKTSRTRSIRPEENMTRAKQKKLIRTCQLYLTNSGYPLDCDWQIDVIAVALHNIEHPEIRHLENVVY